MEKIQIPDFIKKVEPDDLAELARTVSDGDINIYTLVRDESSKVIGSRQVFLRKQIIDELSYLEEQINLKQEVFKKCEKKYKKKLKREVLYLKQLYKVFIESPTYLPLLDSEEISEYNEMVELNLAETFGSIKELTMKKTD